MSFVFLILFSIQHQQQQQQQYHLQRQQRQQLSTGVADPEAASLIGQKLVLLNNRRGRTPNNIINDTRSGNTISPFIHFNTS